METSKNRLLTATALCLTVAAFMHLVVNPTGDGTPDPFYLPEITQAPEPGLHFDMRAAEETYSLYVPENLSAPRRAFVVVTPEDTPAQEFVKGRIGREWLGIATRLGVVVAIVDGGGNVDHVREACRRDLGANPVG